MGQIIITIIILAIIITVISKIFSLIKYIVTLKFIDDIRYPYKVKEAEKLLVTFSEHNEIFDLDQIKKYLARKKLTIKDEHLTGIIEDMEDNQLIKAITLNMENERIWRSNYNGKFIRPVITREIEL